MDEWIDKAVEGRRGIIGEAPEVPSPVTLRQHPERFLGERSTILKEGDFLVDYKGKEGVGLVTTELLLSRPDTLRVRALRMYDKGILNQGFLKDLDDALMAKARSTGRKFIEVEPLTRHRMMYESVGYVETAGGVMRKAVSTEAPTGLLKSVDILPSNQVPRKYEQKPPAHQRKKRSQKRRTTSPVLKKINNRK